MRLEHPARQIIKICLLAIGVTTVVFLLFQYIGFLNKQNDDLFDLFIIHSNNRKPDKITLAKCRIRVIGIATQRDLISGQESRP